MSDRAAPAVLWLTFGSPDGDHDLEPFLASVLASEPAPREVTDLRRRYHQVGWSPLVRSTGELAAAQLDARLRLTHPGALVRVGAGHARPTPTSASPRSRRRERGLSPRCRAAGTPAWPQGCVEVE